MDTSELADEREVLSELADSPEDEGVLDDAERQTDDTAARRIIPYEINSYGADYDVEGLVKRLTNGDIFIPAFQRNFVWTQSDSSRFIESLLLGFPVPAIFLSKESTNRFLVVDGQQRLKSLHSYYAGTLGDRKFRLIGVDSRFAGKSYDELLGDDRRKLDNALIHTIIVQQVAPAESPTEIHSSIYLLFERLNSWGRPLFPQEIRACVDHGTLIDLLHELNNFEKWREMYGKKSKRLKDEELILRFFALLYQGDAYQSPMKTFLNSYCSTNRNLSPQAADEFRTVFFTTITAANGMLGVNAFRPIKAFNAAVFDAVAVGLGKRLALGPINDAAAIKAAYAALLNNQSFKDAYSEATAREEQVTKRLRLACDAFSRVS